MYFTNTQKAAILKAVSSIIVADQHVHPLEMEFMNRVSAKLGIDSTIERIADGMDQNDTTQTISSMNSAQKRLVAATIIGTLMADDKVDFRESVTMGYIFEESNLPRLSNAEYMNEVRYYFE